MSNEKNNFNTSNDSTRILTPNDASIVNIINDFLLTDEPKSIIKSIDLMFEGFLMSENAEHTETRSTALYHYNTVKDLLINLKNLK